MMSEISKGRKVLKVIAVTSEGTEHEIVVFSDDKEYAKKRVQGFAELFDTVALTIKDVVEA